MNPHPQAIYTSAKGLVLYHEACLHRSFQDKLQKCTSIENNKTLKRERLKAWKCVVFCLDSAPSKMESTCQTTIQTRTSGEKYSLAAVTAGEAYSDA